MTNYQCFHYKVHRSWAWVACGKTKVHFSINGKPRRVMRSAIIPWDFTFYLLPTFWHGEPEILPQYKTLAKILCFSFFKFYHFWREMTSQIMRPKFSDVFWKSVQRGFWNEYVTIAVNRNLRNCEVARKKGFSGLQRDSNPWPLRSRCSALPAWAMKTHTLRAGQFIEFINPWKEWNTAWNDVNCRNTNSQICWSTQKLCFIEFWISHNFVTKNNKNSTLEGFLIPALSHPPLYS